MSLKCTGHPLPHTHRGRDYPATEDEKPRSGTCPVLFPSEHLSVSPRSLCALPPSRTHALSSCHLTAVRSDPVTPQAPTLRGPRCSWQNCKLLPVASEALLDLTCRPRPHLLPPLPAHVHQLPARLWLPVGDGWMLSTPRPCQLLRHLTGDWGHPSPPVTDGGAALPCKTS